MKRSIERWQICRPEAMITDQSEAAAIFAMEDARHDILELYDELKRMKSLLKMAAYPPVYVLTQLLGKPELYASLLL